MQLAKVLPLMMFFVATLCVTDHADAQGRPSGISVSIPVVVTGTGTTVAGADQDHGDNWTEVYETIGPGNIVGTASHPIVKTTNPNGTFTTTSTTVFEVNPAGFIKLTLYLYVEGIELIL